MKSVLTGFKDFISRGNAIDLAVAVVIGAAFSKVVGALQTGFIGPLIGTFIGKRTLADSLSIHLRGENYLGVGAILDAALQFVITAAVVYFLIVLPLNKLAERRKKGLVAEPAAPAEDILLLQEIRDLLAGGSSPAIRNDATPTA